MGKPNLQIMLEKVYRAFFQERKKRLVRLRSTWNFNQMIKLYGTSSTSRLFSSVGFSFYFRKAIMIQYLL
ncbi:hypothetical protein OPV22_004820 [Ensete ventricosum]|uniref:Uncharacterized protein n=1 Tax=Ensete ventricosum TaxID=4639 RepID=A0AAV8RJM2_ENSVE|nr:hypothetical protein OPV22_004820 [Ensete ventricosum]